MQVRRAWIRSQRPHCAEAGILQPFHQDSHKLLQDPPWNVSIGCRCLWHIKFTQYVYLILKNQNNHIWGFGQKYSLELFPRQSLPKIKWYFCRCIWRIENQNTNWCLLVGRKKSLAYTSEFHLVCFIWIFFHFFWIYFHKQFLTCYSALHTCIHMCICVFLVDWRWGTCSI